MVLHFLTGLLKTAEKMNYKSNDQQAIGRTWVGVCFDAIKRLLTLYVQVSSANYLCKQ